MPDLAVCPWRISPYHGPELARALICLLLTTRLYHRSVVGKNAFAGGQEAGELNSGARKN